ncbi:hypothetical protein G9P44_004754 [Scheffersomyces stipitis]|nr:hypothetical protein G9P44_004754 [Scheffersomyces stipitis]
MSLTSNRVALAPINNSRLNSSASASSNSTPLKKKKYSRINLTSSTSIALTPSFKKRHSDLNTAAKSFTSHKKFSPIKSISFSDYRSTSSTCSSPNFKISSNRVSNPGHAYKNDAAGLAATKLKLKLQLALYKLQQKQNAKSKLSLSASETIVFSNCSKTSTKKSILSPALESKKSTNLPLSPSASPTPANKVFINNQLPTPPEPAPYSSSININLKTRTKLLSAAASSYKINKDRPSLSKIAYNKQIKSNRNNHKLKLFQIKKNSIFHSSNSMTEKKLPLSLGQFNQVKLPKLTLEHNKSNTSLNIATHVPSAINSFSQNSFLLPFAAASVSGSVRIPSIKLTAPAASSLASFSENETNALPSINKILKTPMRRANSTLFYNNNNNHSNSNQNDDTIDEDNDMTILNTTNNSTINAAANTNNGSILSDSNEKASSDEDKNKTILTSSPIANSFGTPNSFSVAKSLLQLGGHCA